LEFGAPSPWQISKHLYPGLMPRKFSPDLCTKVYNQNELFKT